VLNRGFGWKMSGESSRFGAATPIPPRNESAALPVVARMHGENRPMCERASLAKRAIGACPGRGRRGRRRRGQPLARLSRAGPARTGASGHRIPCASEPRSRNAPLARVPASVATVGGDGDSRWRGFRGQGPLARGRVATGSHVRASLARETRHWRVSRPRPPRPAETGTAAGAAFAGRARSHGGEWTPDPMCERASLAKRAIGACPGLGRHSWRRRGQPLARLSRAGPARTEVGCHRIACASLLGQAKRAEGASPCRIDRSRSPRHFLKNRAEIRYIERQYHVPVLFRHRPR
jgi:hypothetical protein